MVSIALMRILHKQFGDMTNELMKKKIDIIFHARHNFSCKTSYLHKNQEREKSDWMRQEERRERGLDVIYFFHLIWKLCIGEVVSMNSLLLSFLDTIYRHYGLGMTL